MTLSVVMLTSVLAFALVGGSVMHVKFAAQDDDRRGAWRLAESAIDATVQTMAQDPTFGVARAASEVVVLDAPDNAAVTQVAPGNLALPDPQHRNLGIVSFSSSGPIPFSTNNLQGQTASQGWSGRTVPHGCAHIVAVGICGNLQETVEAVVGMPPFPYALACSGQVHSSGSLNNSSIPSTLAVNAQTLDSLAPDALMPGNLASNSDAAQAITLAQSHITGTVEAVGGISLAPGTTVDGSVLPHHDPLYLPSIDVSDELLRSSEYPNVASVSGGSGDLHLSGLNQSGPLTVSGDLVLSQGVVWVNGDLDVTGGVKGTGALFVAGNVRIAHCSTLTSDDTSCIIAQGDVSLGGQDQHSSYFQGIIYTSGNLTASNVTVLGSAVANATDPASGNITLQDARFVMSSQYSQIAWGQAIPGNDPYATYLQFNAGTPSSGLNLGITQMGPGGNMGPLGGPTSSTTNHMGIFGTGDPVILNVPVQVTPGSPTTVTVLGLTMTVDDLKTASGAARMTQMLHDYVKSKAPVGHSIFGKTSAWQESKWDQTAADIVPQIQDIVQRVEANPFTSSQLVNTKGTLFSINLNQFVDLADQMQVLYWAPLDPSKQPGN